MPMFQRLLVSFAVLLGLVAGIAARADEVPAADREAIQDIISSQIDAFRRDDGTAAYSYASPTIQGLFPTVDQFMGMVRNGYMPVYRPRAVTFGAIEASPSGPMQKVFLTGPDGRSWVAIYSLERQPDGSWKINGVRLVEDDGATI